MSIAFLKYSDVKTELYNVRKVKDVKMKSKKTQTKLMLSAMLG